jgi:hypothetical protein
VGKGLAEKVIEEQGLSDEEEEDLRRLVRLRQIESK